MIRVSSRAVEASTPILERIRRQEAEARRRLAAEREAAEAQLVRAEKRARELIAASEIESQRKGEQQRQAALVETDYEAAAIVARARAEADVLRSVGEERVQAAIAQAVRIVIGENRR